MPYDFSIESAVEKIQNANSKRYFQEVYQTFINGNYRSSTVMLYSVLICDLVYKLRDLRDLYADSKAKKILEDIEQMQVANPNSPEWESKLIEYIKQRTNLLEPSDIVAIESLQKFRHLSAHPVLNNHDLLYSPNRDTVQSLIRNILEGILTNPPFFSNKIFDIMMLDLAEIKDKITEDENLKRYVESRYLNRIKENDFKKIYRSLWKVVFITSDSDSVENGHVNYKVLRIFTSHNRPISIESIKSEPSYYSNVNKDEKLNLLIHFLASYPEIYNQLDHSLKLLLEGNKNDQGDYQLMSWFLKDSLVSHIQSLDEKDFDGITEEAFLYVYSLCEANNCVNDLIDFAIKYFGASYSFDESQQRFKKVISVVEDKMTPQQVKNLLFLANYNSQIYYSWGMKQKIQTLAGKFLDFIDTSKYDSIF